MKACIFDLDGVIVDTARYHFLAWKKLASVLGINLTESDNERLKGVGRIESLEIILSLGGMTLPRDKMIQLADRKNKWFVEFIEAMKREEIFSGARELFQELKRHGIHVALASSSKNASTVLKKLDITDEFESIVDGTMITNSKPDPEIFLKSARQLNLAPSECIVIEDAEAGIEAAKRAGMKAVGIGKPQQLHRADYIVDHISKLNFKLLNNL